MTTAFTLDDQDQPDDAKPEGQITAAQWLSTLLWLDRKPLVVEPYRLDLFRRMFDELDEAGRPRFNLLLAGRGKKNAKTLDLVLAALYCLMVRGGQGFILGNDEAQAGDDLALAKKVIATNPGLDRHLKVQKKEINRTDGTGHLEILPAGDIEGSHGKTYTFCGWDEIHGHRDWGILEALQPDPTVDSVQWITSYASLRHRPGIPLYDLCAAGRAGTDPRMLFSWYAGDYTTDPGFADKTPEQRANPSSATFNPGYLEQQRARLPMHRYRRLHLNLPGLPEGAAYTVEAIEGAIDRGVKFREYREGIKYWAYADLSHGSHDDAPLAIGHNEDGVGVMDRIIDQGRAAKFNMRDAIKTRHLPALREFHVHEVYGDAVGGETYRDDYKTADARWPVTYKVMDLTTTEVFETYEPLLNTDRGKVLDIPKLEQQFMGLVWKGAHIEADAGGYDDWAAAAAGLGVLLVRKPARRALEGHQYSGPSNYRPSAAPVTGRCRACGRDYGPDDLTPSGVHKSCAHFAAWGRTT